MGRANLLMRVSIPNPFRILLSLQWWFQIKKKKTGPLRKTDPGYQKEEW